MEEHAYLELHQLERDHWWYRGTRAVYRTLLQRYVPRTGGAVLDLGCGTGGNLALLAEWGRVTGLEPWSPALALCPPGAASLVQGAAQALPFGDDTFALLAALGVIEHVADDERLLRQARRVLRPGGTILLLTSAFMFLWSEHDEANHHVRRYTASQLRRLAARAGLQVRYLGYQNFFLFPLVALVRLLQRLWPRRSEPHTSMFPVPRPLNAALTGLLTLEARLMQHLSLPLGVSLVAVLEKQP